MKLYYSPLSPYSQKVLMAFYEKGASFEPVLVDLMNPAAKAEYKKIHPLGKLPLLVDEAKDWKVPESTTIIEYIDRHCPGGTKLIPDDADLARQVRFRDRFMDLYVNEPMQKIFFDKWRPEGKNDPFGVDRAKETLMTAYETLERSLEGKTWAMGDMFSMADCSAAPALGYCRMVQPFDAYKNVTAYMKRLAERPSFSRVMKEVEPHLANFSKK